MIMQVQHELPAALLQVSKLLCLILYRNNSSKLLYNVNYHQHDIVENNLPATTDHSAGDLASISEHLAVLEWALSTVPTTRALLASLLPSLMVIQGRPRAAPIFLLHTSILAYSDSSMQPGLPDPVHTFAYSSTAVSAATVAAAVCWPHIQYAIIIVKYVF